MSYVWTSRDVEYALDNRDYDIEALLDGLADHYWETGWRHRLLGTLSLSSRSRVIEVSGWRRWVPGWVARRSVTRFMLGAGAGGSARFIVERTVLT